MRKNLMKPLFLRLLQVLCERIIEIWQENYVLDVQTNLQQDWNSMWNSKRIIELFKFSFTPSQNQSKFDSHKIWHDMSCTMRKWKGSSMSYRNKRGADQTVHMHSLISTFLVSCLERAIKIILQKSYFFRFKPVCVAEQVGMRPSRFLILQR